MAGTASARTGLTRDCAIAVLCLLPILWPLIRGERLLLRDIGTTHRPAWALFPTLRFAKVNPAASFGQPYRGNPNLLVFYPFPKSARTVEAHVAAHLALLAAGMTAFLRRRGLKTGAIAGAIAFALSGYVLSASSSLNSLATISWIPSVLLVSGSRSSRLSRFAITAAVLAVFSLAGEPVLIGATLLLASVLVWRTNGPRGMGLFLGAGIAAAILTLPIHRETYSAALESHRVAHGYSFEEAASETLHAGRLIDLIIPGFFGTPAEIGLGSWWGYAVSRNARPYVLSLFLGVIPIVLVLLYGFSTRWRTHRGWWFLLVVSMVFAAAGTAPGANALWRDLPALHAIRFPIKSFLFTTLSIAVLAGSAWDYFSGLFSSSQQRRNAAKWTASAAVVALLLAILAPIRLARYAVAQWWNPHWAGDAGAVVGYATSVTASRLFGLALILTIVFFWIARPRHRWLDGLLLGVLVIDLTLPGKHLLPTIAPSKLSARSRIVDGTIALRGRIFERAGKDLDTTMYGVRGRYPENDARYLAVAQDRQAWALNGAQYGIRYAYDRSPDGSYSWRNHVLQTRLETAPWELRVKWLRGAGVAGVIASSVPEPVAGLRPLVRDAEVGVPVTLYGVVPRLSELRVPEKVRSVRNVEEAIAVFERADFDEAREITVEGTPMATNTAMVEILREQADEIVVRSHATGPTLAFLARSYTRRVSATANGRALRVLPANVHLCAIEIPAGNHEIVVRF